MFARRGSSEFRNLVRERVASDRARLDAARRTRYGALLRRWVLERIPAGAQAASAAAEWVATTLASVGIGDETRDVSALVGLRARLITAFPRELRMRVAQRALPTSRVEQLIGRDHLDAWERALDALPRRQRELVILRVEFGLDDASIATETGLPIAIARAQTVNALAALIDALGGGLRDRAA